MTNVCRFGCLYDANETTYFVLRYLNEYMVTLLCGALRKVCLSLAAYLTAGLHMASAVLICGVRL